MYWVHSEAASGGGANGKACVIACTEEIVHVSESTSVIITWSMAEVDKSALEKTAEGLLHETAELTEVTMEPNVVLTMVEETIGVLTMVDNAVELQTSEYKLRQTGPGQKHQIQKYYM